MKPIVVVEGETDQRLLRWLLAPEIKDLRVDFVVAGGKSAAESLARSLLLRRRSPTALVVDSESEPTKRNEQREFLRGLLPEGIDQRLYHVAIFVPEIEAVLLHSRATLAAIFGEHIPEDVRIQAMTGPRAALERLFQEKLNAKLYPRLFLLLKKISPEEARSHPDVQSLTMFLHTHPADAWHWIPRTTLDGREVWVPIHPNSIPARQILFAGSIISLEFDEKAGLWTWAITGYDGRPKKRGEHLSKSIAARQCQDAMDELRAA